MKTSSMFALDWRDIIKGLLVAVITPVFTIIESSIRAGSLTFNWTSIGYTALAAGMAYLLKNFLTPSQLVSPANPVAK
jgi:hypothetical protein